MPGLRSASTGYDNEMGNQPIIAKITPPRLAQVVPRTRLFRMLDQCNAPVTWIMGPGGSGKTTLVASWLAARKLPCLWYQLDEDDSDIATFFYYLGLAVKKAAPHQRKAMPLLTMEYMRSGGVPSFTRNYFEKLCSRLTLPFVIVLDNYHHIKNESQFHEVVREALSVVPQGISVVILSRSTLPPALALLQTYNKIQSIGWEELKFNMIETGVLFKSGQKRGPSVDLLTHIQQMTCGWAAGLMLLMEQMRRQTGAPIDRDMFNPQGFFDYFATELFEKTDSESQAFLLKTAFLPSVVSPTLLYIWRPWTKFVPRALSIRTPADFGCDCRYSF